MFENIDIATIIVILIAASAFIYMIARIVSRAYFKERTNFIRKFKGNNHGNETQKKS